MNSPFTYTGTVKVTISRKSYKYKNSGYSALFERFSRWLAGEQLDNVVLPASMRLVSSTGATLTFQDISIDKQYRIVESKPACVITGVLIDNNIAAIGDITTFYLELLSGENIPQILAKTAISKDIVEQIKGGRQGLIEWTMTVDNRIVEGATE